MGVADWRQQWAADVRAAPKLEAAYNARLTRDGLTPGVIWPLIRRHYRGPLQLRCSAGGDYLTVQEFSHGVPPALREFSGLPLLPAVRIGRAVRDRVSALRPCMWTADSSGWWVDLLFAAQLGNPTDVAEVILNYTSVSASRFPGLPN